MREAADIQQFRADNNPECILNLQSSSYRLSDPSSYIKYLEHSFGIKKVFKKKSQCCCTPTHHQPSSVWPTVMVFPLHQHQSSCQIYDLLAPPGDIFVYTFCVLPSVKIGLTHNSDISVWIWQSFENEDYMTHNMYKSHIFCDCVLLWQLAAQRDKAISGGDCISSQADECMAWAGGCGLGKCGVLCTSLDLTYHGEVVRAGRSQRVARWKSHKSQEHEGTDEHGCKETRHWISIAVTKKSI